MKLLDLPFDANVPLANPETEASPHDPDSSGPRSETLWYAVRKTNLRYALCGFSGLSEVPDYGTISARR